MTAKEFVKQHYPRARAEMQQSNGYAFDKRKYYLIRDGNAYMYMSEGDTEAKAWKAAKEKILSSLKDK